MEQKPFSVALVFYISLIRSGCLLPIHEVMLCMVRPVYLEFQNSYTQKSIVQSLISFNIGSVNCQYLHNAKLPEKHPWGTIFPASCKKSQGDLCESDAFKTSQKSCYRSVRSIRRCPLALKQIGWASTEQQPALTDNPLKYQPENTKQATPHPLITRVQSLPRK